jgi:hypothetical protein
MFTPWGERSLLLRRMEENREFQPPEDDFTPRGKITPGDQSLSLGDQVKNGPLDFFSPEKNVLQTCWSIVWFFVKSFFNCLWADAGVTSEKSACQNICSRPGFARFFLVQNTKTEKYTKLPRNIQNVHKIYQRP